MLGTAYLLADYAITILHYLVLPSSTSFLDFNNKLLISRVNNNKPKMRTILTLHDPKEIFKEYPYHLLTLSQLLYTYYYLFTLIFSISFYFIFFSISRTLKVLAIFSSLLLLSLAQLVTILISRFIILASLNLYELW